jgi:phosphohistidine phosphatase
MPTLLDLLRHGEAAPAGPPGDGARALTPAGEAKIRALGARLAATEPAPDRAFSSPLLRARQTATIVLSAWKPRAQVETLDSLAPEVEPGELIAALDALGIEGGHVLLVGHLPLLDRLCARLTGSPAGFAAGSLHRIEFAGPVLPGQGRSLWHLDP